MGIRFFGIGIALALSTLMMSSIVHAQTKVSNVDQDVADVANGFFIEWLINRNVEKALNYVSPNKFVSKCFAPEGLRKDKTVRELWKRVLSDILRKSPRSKKLENLIGPTDISADDPEIVFPTVSGNNYFKLYRLRPEAADALYICKFEKDEAFRRAVGNPSVYYVEVTIRGKKGTDPVELVLVWGKEGDEWRLLTMAQIDD